MKRKSIHKTAGSTLVVTISVVATLLVLLGAAVEYSTQVSRTTQRSRKTALAMEIADGHLEMLFTNWRNIYRTTWTTYTASYQGSGGTDYSLLPTNYFYTTCPGCTTSVSSPAPVPIPYMNPAATPPPIPLPSPNLFPSGSNYTVKQYRIQAVNPMIELDANENAVDVNGNPLNRALTAPAAYGPNDWQYSYYYLAAVDVTVPALTGDVTAKVRRVFEKKFDNPWTYAMFYVDDLELQPESPLTITGPIHTNANLYIGTSNFTAQGPTWPNYPTGGRVEYGSDYVNGFSPKETQHVPPITAPNFAKSDATLALSDMPPSQVSPYLPFGWNLNLATGGGANDDSYHELIERPGTGTDPIAGIRYYTQKPYVIDTQNVLAYPTPYPGTPGYAYRILINEANTAATVDTITIYKWDGTNATAVTGGTYNSIAACVQTNKPIKDNREGGLVRTTILDVNAFSNLVTGNNPTLPSFSGVLYIADAGATYQPPSGTPVPGTPITCTLASTTENNVTRRAIRLKNGATLKGKLTIVSDNPVYIQGDYNTGVNPLSNTGTYTSPTAAGYTRWSSAVIADSISVLSNNWTILGDANSLANRSSRLATSTTINAALVSGNVPSGTINGNYSGGGENFVRFLEDWDATGITFCYYGSMVQLFKSQQGAAAWSGTGNQYKAPALKWYYDINFSKDHKDDPHWGSPPGNLQIAAYLQQQRWYQVY